MQSSICCEADGEATLQVGQLQAVAAKQLLWQAEGVLQPVFEGLDVLITCRTR